MTEPVTLPDPDAPAPDKRARHDAFDARRKQLFVDALKRTGCLRAAARKIEVSHQTVYNHQRTDKLFARQCELALSMAGSDIELQVWERAVIGVEEPIVYHGEIVGTRLKRSDAMLRLLLMGAMPKKYGRNPGFTRKRLLKEERKRIECEIHADIATKRRDPEEVKQSILTKIEAIKRHREPERLAQGWIRLDDGHWIPPGWARVDAGFRAHERAEQAADSV